MTIEVGQQNFFSNFFSSKFFKYCFFGGIAALIELGTFFAFTEFNIINYFFAAPISFALAAITNYFLQRKFTFKNKYSKKHKQFTIFFIIAIGGLIINWTITIIGVEFFYLWPTLAKFIAILIALGYNYTLNKKITFGKMQ